MKSHILKRIDSLLGTTSKLSFFAVLALLLAACGGAERTDEILGQDTITVSVLSLQQRDSAAVIHASGVFTTDDETLLSFKNGGIIDRIYVEEGDAIKNGQLLAKLNPTEINAMVAQAKLAFEKAERDYNRASQLYKDSVATLEQMENARTGLEVARQDMNTVQFNQRYSEIRSSSNGFVLMKLANEGQVVGPGTPVLQVNGASKGDWQLKTGVSDKQWAAIQVGDAAEVTFDALPGRALSAAVSKKAEGVDMNSGTFSVHLKVTDKDVPALAAGMFAKAAIFPTKTTGAYYIPFSALMDGDAGSGYVFVTDDGQTARRVKVQIGAISADHVAITAGLENIRSLIISGSPYLRDGSAIKIR